MPMNELLKTKLFSLLAKDSQQEVSNDEMKNAYGNFAEQVKIVNQPENNYLIIFRILSITRIELLFLSTQIQYEQGKKCT